MQSKERGERDRTKSEVERYKCHEIAHKLSQLLARGLAPGRRDTLNQALADHGHHETVIHTVRQTAKDGSKTVTLTPLGVSIVLGI
jgi:hypothetical protein